MAVDETLLEWSAGSGGAALRLYGWQPATLSLGYFQRYTERARHAASRECPAVRRPSGGGAIVHDREITYSLVVPAGHALAVRRRSLYESVHRALVDALSQWRIAATCCESAAEASAGPQPFLCFQRRTQGDVLLGQFKIAGSAQRRVRGAVLQHGSVLWARSPAAPELPGVSDVAATAIALEPLVAAWTERLARVLGMEWRASALCDQERVRADGLKAIRYAAACWTEHRQRPAPD